METGLLERSPGRVFASLAGRVVLYSVILGAIFFGLMSCGAQGSTLDFYDETGPVEILQIVTALAAAIIFFAAGRVDRTKAPSTVMIALFLLCLIIRELDFFLDEYVARHAWKILVALVVVCMTVYTIRKRRELMASLLEFISHPSFGVLLAGLLVLTVFSRLFGYGDFWEELIEGSFYRTVKTIVEETSEQIAYFLLLIASCEFLHDARIRRRLGSADKPQGAE